MLPPRVRTAFVLAMIWCAALAAFARAGGYTLALALLFVAGFVELAFNSMAQALVQINAPNEIRGRVIGVFSMSANGLRTFSGFSVGLLGASSASTIRSRSALWRCWRCIRVLLAARYFDRRERWRQDRTDVDFLRRALALATRAQNAERGAGRRGGGAGRRSDRRGMESADRSARPDRARGNHRSSRRRIRTQELPARGGYACM